MAKRGDKKPFAGDGTLLDGFGVWARRYLEHLRVRNYSERTIVATEGAIRLFAEWASDRGVERPHDVTKPMLEVYQRWLFHYRSASGRALKFSAQRQRLQKLRVFYRWLAREN